MVTPGLSGHRCGDSRAIQQAQLTDGQENKGADEEQLKDKVNPAQRVGKINDRDNNETSRH